MTQYQGRGWPTVSLSQILDILKENWHTKKKARRTPNNWPIKMASQSKVMYMACFKTGDISSVVEHLPSMYKPLGLIPSTEKKKKKKL